MSDIIDAEIILTETEAHEITSRIRAWVNAFPADDIAAAYTRRIWVTLGYDDWEEYLDSEFDIAGRLRLPAPERAEVVNELADAGMSNRAIAASLGVDEKTVRNDKAGAEKSAPDVTGRDGKTYKPKPKVVNIDGTPHTPPKPPKAEPPQRIPANERYADVPAPEGAVQVDEWDYAGKTDAATRFVLTYVYPGQLDVSVGGYQSSDGDVEWLLEVGPAQHTADEARALAAALLAAADELDRLLAGGV